MEGKLIERTKFGPPGWGDTPDNDQVLHGAVLLLRKPHTVQGDPNSDLNTETVADFEEVQLIDLPDYRRYLGKDVSISGVLNLSITGWTFTKITKSDVRLVHSTKK